ncbi:MAG: TatD family hydrolase, partial [Acidobacteriota bacterium]
ADLDAVVLRAREAGLTGALCIVAAGEAGEAAAATRVQALWPAVRVAVGIHPHQAAAFAGSGADPAGLVRGQVAATGACAIGEIGLDYHYDFSPRAVQHVVFGEQVGLARELRLPVVIHTREATADTFAILKERGGVDIRGVFHCFTGDLAMAEAALDLGFHVSFAGIVTFPKAAALREIARMIPSERLLAETDSPYLAPVPHRGTRNEPALVARVIETLAQVRGEPADELAAQVTRNFDALFGSTG